MEKLFKGDCLNHLKMLEDNSVDLVIIDPPYEIETKGGLSLLQRNSLKVFTENQLDNIAKGFNFEILDELCRVMKKINIYIFCSQKQLRKLLSYFVDNKGCNWNLLTWHKSNPPPLSGNKYLSDTEYILYFREKGVKIHGTYASKFTYYVTPTNQKEKEKYKHPTIKPLHIIQNLITNSSLEGDTVLDCFMGSGTTGVASKILNRNFIGMELDDNHFETAKTRLEETLCT